MDAKLGNLGFFAHLQRTCLKETSKMTVEKKKQPLTNAIANAGMRVR